MLNFSKKWIVIALAVIAIFSAIAFGILSFLIFAAPVTFPLAGLTIFACWRWWKKHPRPVLSIKVSLGCLGFPVGMFVCYAAYFSLQSHQYFTQTVQAITNNSVVCLFCTQFFISLLLPIYVPKGTRLFLGTILAWELLLSAWIGFIVNMSITGNYL
ncbi:MAG: hypothetical protein AAF821_15730 [Cyanobacteria bacterium P01_D01_bin.156]